MGREGEQAELGKVYRMWGTGMGQGTHKRHLLLLPAQISGLLFGEKKKSIQIFLGDCPLVWEELSPFLTPEPVRALHPQATLVGSGMGT